MRPCSSGIKSGICKHLFKKRESEGDIIMTCRQIKILYNFEAVKIYINI